MPRRRSLLSLLAAASAAVLPAPAAAAPARSAGAFVDSVGVNTHIIYDDTAYGDFATVRARLKELGVRHIRDGICGTCLWQWERYETLATDGIRLNAGAGWPNATALQRTQALAAMRRLAPMIETIEGANEWDLFSGRTSTWPTEVRAHQSWLANAVRADAALRTKPIIGPSLVFSWETPSSWTILNDVSANLDYGNSHGYAGGLAPELAVDAELARAGQISGTKPMIQTEGGYHNALGQGNWDHPAVPEDVAGAYMPRMFLENFRRGVRRTYSYELLDEWHGQARTNMEASFGLLRSDFGRKPAYDSLRNLLTVLGEPGAPAGTTEVPVIVSTTGGDVRQLLLRKADGRVAVVLWRAASLWDRVARTRTAVATVPVTVAYTGTVLTAATYAPVESAMARRATLADGGITLNVGAAPVILELTPAPIVPIATPTPAPPTPTPAPPTPTPAPPAPPTPPRPTPAPPAPTPAPPAPTPAPPVSTPTRTPTPTPTPKPRKPRRPHTPSVTAKTTTVKTTTTTSRLTKARCRSAKAGSRLAKRCRTANRARR